MSARPQVSIFRALLAIAAIAISASQYILIPTYGVIIFLLVGGALSGLALIAKPSDWRRLIRAGLTFVLAAIATEFLPWVHSVNLGSAEIEYCFYFANVLLVWLMMARSLRFFYENRPQTEMQGSMDKLTN